MGNKKKGKMQKFVEFVNDENLDSFHSSPESLKKFDEGLASVLKRAETAQAHSWISKAKSELSTFTEQIKYSVSSKFSAFSRAELLAELKGQLQGEFTFQHQFRNKKPEDLSDSELRSILDDQELLKTLSQQKGTSEDGSGEGKS